MKTRRSTHHIMEKNFRIMRVVDVIQNMSIEEKKRMLYDFFVNDKSYGLTFAKLEERASELVKEPAWINAKTMHELVNTELFKSIKDGYVLCMMRVSCVIVGYQFYRTKLSVASKILLCNRKAFGIKDSKVTEEFNLIRDSIISAIDQDMFTRDEIINYALENLKPLDPEIEDLDPEIVDDPPMPIPPATAQPKPMSAVEELTGIHKEEIENDMDFIEELIKKIRLSMKSGDFRDAKMKIAIIDVTSTGATRHIDRIIEINEEK